MSPLLLSLITFVIVMGGACLGAVLRNTLPGHHLVDDAKELCATLAQALSARWQPSCSAC